MAAIEAVLAQVGPITALEGSEVLCPLHAADTTTVPHFRSRSVNLYLISLSDGSSQVFFMTTPNNHDHLAALV